MHIFNFSWHKTFYHGGASASKRFNSIHLKKNFIVKSTIQQAVCIIYELNLFIRAKKRLQHNLGLSIVSRQLQLYFYFPIICRRWALQIQGTGVVHFYIYVDTFLKREEAQCTVLKCSLFQGLNNLCLF